MQSLRGWRVVDKPDLECMGFLGFKTCEFNHTWVGPENAIRTDIVVNIYNNMKY